MWPPRSPGLRLARTTIAIAFQRISERMRHSICASPGDLASWPGGMVLMYSVVGANGRCAPARRVSSTMPLSSWCARAGPSWSMTALSDSIHSCDSAGSGSLLRTSLSQFIGARSAAARWPRSGRGFDVPFYQGAVARTGMQRPAGGAAAGAGHRRGGPVAFAPRDGDHRPQGGAVDAAGVRLFPCPGEPHAHARPIRTPVAEVAPRAAAAGGGADRGGTGGTAAQGLVRQHPGEGAGQPFAAGGGADVCSDLLPAPHHV